MCSNIRTSNNHHFPFGTNGKVVELGVPILKHFRVHTNGLVKIPEQINISTVATSDESHKQSDDKMICFS